MKYLLFAIAVMLAARSPSDADIQKAIAQTEAAQPSETATAQQC